MLSFKEYKAIKKLEKQVTELGIEMTWEEWDIVLRTEEMDEFEKEWSWALKTIVNPKMSNKKDQNRINWLGGEQAILEWGETYHKTYWAIFKKKGWV
jgi:hypothetical protein